MPWIPRYGQPFGAAPPLAFHGRRLSRENCPHKALQSSPVSHRAGHDCSGVLIGVNSSPCLVAWLVWDCLYPFANSAAILSTSISNVQTHVQYMLMHSITSTGQGREAERRGQTKSFKHGGGRLYPTRVKSSSAVFLPRCSVARPPPPIFLVQYSTRGYGRFLFLAVSLSVVIPVPVVSSCVVSPR